MKQIILFGAGEVGKEFLGKFGDDVFCFADNFKTGEFCGKKIITFDELKRIHKDYEIVISVRNQLRNELGQQCEDAGIKLSNRNGMWRYGCSQMQQMLSLTSTMAICCNSHEGIHRVELTGDWKADYETVYEYRKLLIEKLEHGERCDCDGCAMLQKGFYLSEPDLKTVTFGGDIDGERCNAKCIYCGLTKSGLQTRRAKFTLLEILEGISDYITEGMVVWYAAAEITISPYKHEFFEFVRKKKLICGIIPTSGILYSNEVAETLKNSNKTILNISLDSGTRETYLKVKGVDAFDIVVKNIAKYRQCTQLIDLKYILLEGVNDNEEDILGFLNIVKDNNTRIIITVDINTKEAGVSDNIFHWIEYFENTAKKMIPDVNVRVLLTTFSAVDAEKMRAILNGDIRKSVED